MESTWRRQLPHSGSCLCTRNVKCCVYPFCNHTVLKCKSTFHGASCWPIKAWLWVNWYMRLGNMPNLVWALLNFGTAVITPVSFSPDQEISSSISNFWYFGDTHPLCLNEKFTAMILWEGLASKNVITDNSYQTFVISIYITYHHLNQYIDIFHIWGIEILSVGIPSTHCRFVFIERKIWIAHGDSYLAKGSHFFFQFIDHFSLWFNVVERAITFHILRYIVSNLYE